VKSRVYEGWVTHRRERPRPHFFRYRVFLMYLDLDELPSLFDPYLLWSARHPAPAWFRRADHLGDPGTPLDTAVRDLVAVETGARPAGPVRLLTHLRYLGYCMNPVSFYYCWSRDESRLDFIVAEVHNTPWGEQHSYVLDCRALQPDELRFRFAKNFHVSPFMSMEQRYDWRFSVPGARLAVRMDSFESSERVFGATMTLAEAPVTARSLAVTLARHPFMTAKVILAIYWQALRLWLKGTPFHVHPKHHIRREIER